MKSRARAWRANYILKLANKLILQKNYPEAMIMLTECNIREPTLPDAFLSRGLCLLHMEKYEPATIAVFDQAILLKPDYANAFYNRGLCRHKMALQHITLSGNTINEADKQTLQRAVADYTACINLDKFFMEAYTNRASIHGRLRDPRRAAADLNKAVQCMDETSELHALYGDLMVEKFVESGGVQKDMFDMNEEKSSAAASGDEDSDEDVEALENDKETGENNQRLIQLRRKSIEGKGDLLFIYKNRLQVLNKLGQTESASIDLDRVEALEHQ